MDVFVEARHNPVFGSGLREAPLRRDLESAIAFHWMQDVARVLAGF